MARIANIAPVGSLLERKPRQRDGRYLVAIRELPCLICRVEPCREAAHVRMGSEAGMGRKPDDRRAAPLCHTHHMQQHTGSERQFWDEHRVDIEQVIRELVAAYPNIGTMRSIILRHAA
jgi:hypothetical protein